MRHHEAVILSVIVFVSSQAMGRTLTAHLEYARMDTCSALPGTYSYTGMHETELVRPRSYLPSLADPMTATLRLNDADSLVLVWGKDGGDDEQLAFYRLDDETEKASEIQFVLKGNEGRRYYQGSMLIPGDSEATPDMLLRVEYYPGRKTMMYRRLDFRLGSVDAGGRTIPIALASENELSFTKASRCLLLIDEDGDGHFRTDGEVDTLGRYKRTEAYQLDQPFPLGASVYRIARLASDGYELELTESEAATGLNVGLRVPDLEIATLDGQIIKLGQLRGKIVVLNWWHVRCSPCIEEMPSLNELVKEHSSGNVVFLGVADSTPEELQVFFGKHEFDYRTTLCSNRLKELLGDTYPRHVIIDRAGVVCYDQTGGSPRTGKKLDTVISALKAP